MDPIVLGVTESAATAQIAQEGVESAAMVRTAGAAAGAESAERPQIAQQAGVESVVMVRIAQGAAESVAMGQIAPAVAESAAMVQTAVVAKEWLITSIS